MTKWERRIKRSFDIIISFILLLLLSPVIITVSLLILFRIGPPIFFFQSRPGKFGVTFKMVKFRTMTNEKGEDGQLLPSEERITKLGNFLRSTSLDELPELINVFFGQMSFVGPRPLLAEYLPLYNQSQKARHDVKPGITGWAQVNGRNAISWEEKFDLDVWYVNNYSLGLDMKILWQTLRKVYRREGITHSSDVMMPKFTGSKPKEENV